MFFGTFLLAKRRAARKEHAIVPNGNMDPNRNLEKKKRIVKDVEEELRVRRGRE